MNQADIRIELEEMIMNNFTGEYNSFDEITNKLNDYSDATAKLVIATQKRLKDANVATGEGGEDAS